MKLTSNYIVYLNADNKVHCAKCLNTGRFVKRSIAQLEYENEYNYFNISILTMFLLFVNMYISNLAAHLENTMNTVAMNLDQVLTHFNKGVTDFTIIEQEDYSLYVTIENSSISAHLYLGKYKIELGHIGKISQDYVTISDNLISDLNSIGVNLSYLQLDIQC